MLSTRSNFQGSTISRSPMPRELVFECPYEIRIGLHFMQKSTLPRPISNGHSVKQAFTQSSRASCRADNDQRTRIYREPPILAETSDTPGISTTVFPQFSQRSGFFSDLTKNSLHFGNKLRFCMTYWWRHMPNISLRCFRRNRGIAS